MHTFLVRLNSTATFFGTVVAVLALLTATTDLFHRCDPTVKLGLAEVKRLYPLQNSRDQALITFNLEADLRSCFSWNTKQLFVFVRADYWSDEGKLNQVVLWDSIIQQKERAVIKLKKHKTKYAFIGHGHSLRDRAVNLTLVWDNMPRVGALFMTSRSVPIGSLPAQYT